MYREIESLYYLWFEQVLVELLRGGGWDVNSRDMLGDAPIHTIVRTKTKKRFDFLMALLVHGSPNVDLASDSTSGNAALHIAVEVYKRGLKF